MWIDDNMFSLHKSQILLTEIVTKDKLIHVGLFIKPKKTSPRAILFVHGKATNFYNNRKILEAISFLSQARGYGIAAFNNRGHDCVTYLQKTKKRKFKELTSTIGGAACEKFEECILDIDAGITFLNNQGFMEIILVGHSTGANKVCFYAYKKTNKRVVGIILESPVSDRLYAEFKNKYIGNDISHMRALIKHGKRNVPQIGYDDFPITPYRFLSLYSKDSLEDVFDYDNSVFPLLEFSKIRSPVLVLLAEKDEYFDRPFTSIKNVFDSCTRSKHYKSIVIPGATHRYTGKEYLVANEIVRWINDLP